MADPKTSQGPGGSSAAKVRWIIILTLAGLGVFLYLRSRKQKQAQAQDQTAQGSAGYQGTNSVPTYSVSASGLYNGGYTPYTIINTSPTNMNSTFPGAQGSPSVTQTNTNSVQSSGITQSQSTAFYGN